MLYDASPAPDAAAANRAAHPEVAAWIDGVRRVFGGAKVTYFGPTRPFTRRRATAVQPGPHRAQKDLRPMHEKTAAERGHTTPIVAESGEYDFEGWTSPDADLDGIFAMTCGDTGDVLELRGWLFAVTLNPAP